jgi:PAS domain-containing protein
MFVAAFPDRNEPISLVEIQTPVMYENKLEEVLVLIQDVSSVRASLDQVVSRSALFLFSVATVFLIIIILIAQMARKVIKKQNYSERQLTESKQQLEKKHLELEQLFDFVAQAKYEWQMALDCISDMILLVDEAGQVKRCNQAFIRFIGCSYLEVLGKNWQQVLFRGNLGIISLDQQNNKIYHQQNRVWLQLEFYPYAAEQKEKLTVIKIQRQDQNNHRNVIENIKKAQ